MDAMLRRTRILLLLVAMAVGGIWYWQNAAFSTKRSEAKLLTVMSSFSKLL